MPQQPARTVGHVLYGQSGQQDAEHAGHDVHAGPAQQLAQRSGEPECRVTQHQHDTRDPEDHDQAEGVRSRLRREDHEARERTRARDHGDRQRKHADVGARARLFFLFLRLTLVLRQDHVHRDQEQQDPAGHPEGIHADAEVAEQPGPDQAEGREQRAGDEHGLACDPALLVLGPTAGERQEHRHQADRIHHDEQREERLEGQAFHAQAAATGEAPSNSGTCGSITRSVFQRPARKRRIINKPSSTT